MELTPQQRTFFDSGHFAVVPTMGPKGMPHQTVMWYMLALLNTPFRRSKHRHFGQASVKAPGSAPASASRFGWLWIGKSRISWADEASMRPHLDQKNCLRMVAGNDVIN